MCWQQGVPAGARDRQIAEGMAALHAQLREHLPALGCTVRDESDFGLPESVKPMRGRIGRWTKGADGTLGATLDLPDLAPAS